MIPRMQHQDRFWQSAFEAHGPAVLGFLRRRIAARDEAEDLLQETFVRAIRADSFRPDGNLRAYLMSTARNLLINRLRRPRLVVAVDTTSDDQRAPSPLERATDPGVSPEQHAALSSFRERLEMELAQLSDDHRLAFELAIRQQLPYSDIGRQTGWSLSRIKINVYRARQRLIRVLGDVLPQADWRSP